MTASYYATDGVTQIVAGPGISITPASGVGVVEITNTGGGDGGGGGGSITGPEVIAALGYTPVNKAGDTLAGALNAAFPALMAASATMNIGAAGSNFIFVVSAGTISGFDTISAPAERTLVFQYPCTIINSSSLPLPGGANLNIQAGDVLTLCSSNSGNWFVKSFQPLAGYAQGSYLPKAGGTLTGALNWAAGVVMPVASTMNIGAASSNFILVTAGSGSISAFDSITNPAERTLVMQVPATIINSTHLQLPGGQNINLQVNDVITFCSSNAGNWFCKEYTPIAGYFNLATGGTISGASQAIGAASTLFTGGRVGFGDYNAATLTASAWTPSNVATLSGTGYITSYAQSGSVFTSSQAGTLEVLIRPLYAALSCLLADMIARKIN